MNSRIIITAAFLLSSIALTGQVVHPQYEIKSIYFGGGSYYFDGKQKQELIDWLDEFPNLNEYEIYVHSHTDNIGGIQYNQWLSQMRSNSVIGYMVQQHIPREWIQIKDYGELNPLYDNANWNGKLNNRRVDVILIPPSS